MEVLQKLTTAIAPAPVRQGPCLINVPSFPLRFGTKKIPNKSMLGIYKSQTGFRIKKGNDLLSHKCSTIGANGLNFSVRN
uniref:hypothetical protein n=1 Tax=Hwangdonia seohaensis TaxID=1240727 RepID=UPI00289A78CF